MCSVCFVFYKLQSEPLVLVLFCELKCKKGEGSVNEFIELEKRCREVGLVMETYMWWQIVPRRLAWMLQSWLNHRRQPRDGASIPHVDAILLLRTSSFTLGTSSFLQHQCSSVIIYNCNIYYFLSGRSVMFCFFHITRH